MKDGIVRAFVKNPAAVAGVVFLVLEVLVALFAPALAQHDPTAVVAGAPFLPPGSPGFPLGTDDLGRDILARMLYGSRITLAIGIAVLILAAAIGIPLGLLAGFYRPWDGWIMRAVDVLLALPSLLLALLVAVIAGSGINGIVVAVSLFSIPSFARVTRSVVLSTVQLDYVEAARAGGAGDPRVLVRHVLPNCVGPLIVQASFNIATAILTAAALDFLGLGVKPPTPEWGAMLGQGRAFLFRDPSISLFPGLAIFLTVMALNLVGDGLRDAADPRMRH